MFLFKYLLAFGLTGSAMTTIVAPRKALPLGSSATLVPEHPEDQPPALNVVEVNEPAPTSLPVVILTNAERMAAGLPLLPPRRRWTRTCMFSSLALSFTTFFLLVLFLFTPLTGC